MSDDLYAGVDLGGTTITAGLAAADGRLVASRTVRTDGVPIEPSG
jgi:sugar (pentulose or hexulose) kinase